LKAERSGVVPILDGMYDRSILEQPIVVAIPVKNEAERIQRCLLALASQTMAPDVVVLLMNNCDDDSEHVASQISRQLPFQLEVASVTLDPVCANAGNARRLAMNFAAQISGPRGTLLTTDADAIVASDWISRNVAALALGADAVCGRILIDPVEALAIPHSLHADDHLECELLDLLDEIAFKLDPEAHDPRPRHTQASGASLAISTRVLERVGGIPPVAAGEDRALIDALIRIDARIRHDPEITVVVSGRLVGRAPGGMADTMRRRMVTQDEYADDLVEPAADTYRRIDFRRRTRLAWRQAGTMSSRTDLAIDLRLTPTRLEHILSQRYFGNAWAQVQRESPMMPRRRVRFADLSRQIEVARKLLRTDVIVAQEGNAMLGQTGS
jgi:hypothetical protein